MLEEQRLDSKRHDRAAFDCGIPELNHYLTRRATQDRRRNLTQVYVLVDTDAAEPGARLLHAERSSSRLREDIRAGTATLAALPYPVLSDGPVRGSAECPGPGLGKVRVGNNQAELRLRVCHRRSSRLRFNHRPGVH